MADLRPDALANPSALDALANLNPLAKSFAPRKSVAKEDSFADDIVADRPAVMSRRIPLEAPKMGCVGDAPIESGTTHGRKDGQRSIVRSEGKVAGTERIGGEFKPAVNPAWLKSRDDLLDGVVKRQKELLESMVRRSLVERDILVCVRHCPPLALPCCPPRMTSFLLPM